MEEAAPQAVAVALAAPQAMAVELVPEAALREKIAGTKEAMASLR